ncbi:MAG: F0F1 ATP synthase subunit gamma [Motilibacteraceae bacterium]
MGAQLRVLRRQIRSVQATKKITRAMELISASRIVKAQQRVEAARPYTAELVRAIETAAEFVDISHPLVGKPRLQQRAAVLIVTADRGLAGAYSSNALKQGEALTALLREEGKEVVPFLVGRKGVSFYKFRGREVGNSWVGFSDNPSYADAKKVADELIERFVLRTEDGGFDEIHIVYTHFRSMVTQETRARRILPLIVEESTASSVASDVREGEGQGEQNGQNGQSGQSAQQGSGMYPLYEFEPSAEAVLDALLPRYVANLVYLAMLDSAASEHAARRRAMSSATDNAEELVRAYTRQANTARQAEITQEISEIVGGANALADATVGSE